MSIIDYTGINPAIDPTAFPNTPNDEFWTSSVQTVEGPFPSHAAWAIDSNCGGCYSSSYDVDGRLRVRCVRTAWSPSALDGSAPSSCYTAQNGTAYDTRTKLWWQQAVASGSLTWDAAQQYCQTLVLDGSGWRVPTIQELETLVDDRRVNPSIDPTAFPNATSDYFWTSSIVSGGAPGYAWIIGFYSGMPNPSAATSRTYAVRCVR